MATYQVKFGDSEGGIGVREAVGAGPEEVRRQFTREGYYVFDVKRNVDLLEMLGVGRKIPIREFLVFNKSFRGLVKAGMPIVEGLDIVLKRMKDGRLKNFLNQVRERLHRGESLAQAFEGGDLIPRYYPALLAAGEQSGDLVTVLDRFIAQEERLRQARKRFRQAMTYPMILLAAGMVALYIILTRAMPEFAALYEGSNQELPWITNAVIGLSDWFSTWYGALFATLIAVVVGTRLYLSTSKGALMGERLLRMVPLVGPLWRLQNQNIFAHTMQLLLAGGIPVPQALQTLSGAVPSRAFGQELDRVQEAVNQGESLNAAVDAHTKLGEMASEMLRVGEATGSLADMFGAIGEHGEERAEDYLEIISGFVAPAMLLLIGLIISLMVTAMYLPMFGSYENLGL